MYNDLVEAVQIFIERVKTLQKQSLADENYLEANEAVSKIRDAISLMIATTPAPLPLHEYGKETNEINAANGWHIPSAKDWTDSEYIIPTFLMLIVSEVSEALEAFRKNDEVNFCEELADVFIRLVNLADGLGIDLDTAVREKLEKNRGRGHKHGGKRV